MTALCDPPNSSFCSLVELILNYIVLRRRELTVLLAFRYKFLQIALRLIFPPATLVFCGFSC
jgi:hypothetical protein